MKHDHTSESIAKAVERMDIVGPARYHYRDGIDDYVDLGSFEESKPMQCACGATFEYGDELRIHVLHECELANE